ncbi:MAG: TatD family hydrolase [Deltaproteobacteria bacterium]|nr:TatD family hydrolase [Deltaproteobacteria bacterium]
MLTDSHAHLDMPEFDDDRGEVIRRALEGGVTRIITIGIDLPSSHKALEIANKYDFIYSTVGYHPHNAKLADREALDALYELAKEPRVVAWGEIGLDFFRNHSARQTQIAIFEEQIMLAGRVDLPLIIHDREAHKEVYEILNKTRNSRQRGVIHCYSGDYPLAMAFIGMGFYISVPGTVTYKNASTVRDVAAKIPIEFLLVETDAPFLTPSPYRGKRNEPLFVTHTARRIAELRGMDFQDLARRTTENTNRIFGLDGTS